MKNRLLSYFLLAMLSTLFTCSNNDDSQSKEVVDTRIKFAFDYEGDIAFIGDQSNKVLKRFYKPQNGFMSYTGYYFNEQTKSMKIIAGGPSFYNYSIIEFNAYDLYNSGDGNTNYTVTETPINLDEEEQIVLTMFHSENKSLLLTKIYPDDNYRIRTFENDVLTTTESIHDLMPFRAAFASSSYCQNLKQLLNQYQDVQDELLQRYNTETWTQAETTIVFPRTIFNNFGHGNEAFLITRSEFNEQLHTIDGTVLGTITDSFSYLGSACIGYDIVDERYEYLRRSDGRNESGTINTTNGEIERTGLAGEPGFIESPLFFFNL